MVASFHFVQSMIPIRSDPGPRELEVKYLSHSSVQQCRLITIDSDTLRPDVQVGIWDRQDDSHQYDKIADGVEGTMTITEPHRIAASQMSSSRAKFKRSEENRNTETIEPKFDVFTTQTWGKNVVFNKVVFDNARLNLYKEIALICTYSHALIALRNLQMGIIQLFDTNFK
ncbi:hypothetical protein NPIL_437301 [Nephila pilipes]|uniref:Uncharacterized protein n=1 Tax=Nephila pilipes TaxID=299642 RepID=A0A8X6UE28_NEPPI|nr:hypothetical protein NPIL_437301 [Nephila pilipes]